MNLPNKITMGRIVLSIMLLILLVFPFSLCGIDFPKYELFGTISVDLKYIIGGVIFLIASLTDFIDGNIARKRNLVTDFGKVMDAIADKVLVNGVLVVLACNGVINEIIPVIIITRDIFVDSIKMVAGSKGKAVGASILGKLKTICMMSGLTLTFFYNIPFELINLDVANGLLYIACVLSIISGVQYYLVNKEYFKEK
ncbi:cDP-diacylglycerol-glycerol-3-phosphate 3-phosphatidyltransferase [Firmicutes bacterium CAG:582]|jgi:CDP-diacylglycerol--glycerol-3-phosphate 3-phosphatidyltransferase|nr:CDP-diacylglycerol--glycerol-3-phosphate 3-phosphatidyltransferase [bacterium]CDB28170.1 cDP-diacylglycerol-glycerol-3-phosphate 3-phosphatidyltransferase [Firmicutes bacterium CAG:582]